VVGLTVGYQPMSDAGQRLAKKGRSGLRGIEAAGPAAECRGIGHAIGVFQRGHRLFPRAVLLKAPPQGLATSQQAVVGVRERKPRQEGEGLPAIGTATATDPNPFVTLVVCLLAATAVTDDRIAFANRASPQDDLFAVSSPVAFQLVRRTGKWDKKNRSSSGLCSGIDLAKDLSRKRSLSS